MSEKRTCPPKTPCPMDGFQTRCPKLWTDDCPAWHAWHIEKIAKGHCDTCSHAIPVEGVDGLYDCKIDGHSKDHDMTCGEYEDYRKTI